MDCRFRQLFHQCCSHPAAPWPPGSRVQTRQAAQTRAPANGELDPWDLISARILRHFSSPWEGGEGEGEGRAATWRDWRGIAGRRLGRL